MELSRRGVLGGLGAVCAVGAVGFAGATAVDDGNDSGDDDDGAAASVAVDPEAPFEARLLHAVDDAERSLFGATDLKHVQGVLEEDGEHLVYVALSEAGRESFRNRLDDSGATDDPEPFAVSMTLDGDEVRHVDLDEPTVTALTDEEWGGVLTLPFQSAETAESVYGSLAAE